MAGDEEISESLLRQVRRMQALVKDLPPQSPPLLKQIGAIIVKECRKAFVMQRLGDLEWPARYEGMSDPFINIAGALVDWNSGRPNPKPNRFQDRPALVDERNLWQSITHKLWPKQNTILFGTAMQYARIHQEGGDSEITISDQAKDAIYNWLYSKSRKWGMVPSKKKVTHHGRSGKESRQKDPRAAYAKHVEPLIHMDVWRQRVAKRAFIGVTNQAEHEVSLAVKYYFEKGMSR